MAQSPPTGYIEAPPNVLLGSYTPFYRSIPHFTGQYPILNSFWSLFFVSKVANSKREKQLQNDTKGVDPPLQGILRPPNG